MDDADELKAIIAIWERSIDTQKHFNDLCLRTRQLGVTIVGAMLGVGFVLKADINPLSFHWFVIPILSVLCAAAGAMMYLTKALDIDVYHRMLRGAVAFNEDLEHHLLLKHIKLEQGLSETITIYSRFKDAHRVTIEGKSRHTGVKEESLRHRMSRFYNWATIGLLAIGLTVAIGANIGSSDSTAVGAGISGRNDALR